VLPCPLRWVTACDWTCPPCKPSVF